MQARSRKKNQPATSLPEDLLIEILARVPFKSLCRFNCVSQSWLALCSDPDLRKRSPQALSGFFCFARDDEYHELSFLNLSGKGRPLVDPDLPFLRGIWDKGVRVMDCCSSLLLCLCWKSSSTEADYVVCNPATEKWTVLPATKELHTKNIVRLGFDPAFPSRFAVFVLVQDLYDREITGVEIFSSETARWTYTQSQWGHETSVDDVDGSVSVFFSGTLHLTTRDSSVITVDTEGKTWHEIRMPLSMEDTTDYGFIAECQGRLYAMHMDYSNDRCQLSVWVLENYASGQWTIKHTTNMKRMIGVDEVCTLVAFNSERNLIIHINGQDEKLVSYNMDSRKSHVIFSFERFFHLRCYPYIPCYAEWLLKAAP
jgi:F-box interacting protein